MAAVSMAGPAAAAACRDATAASVTRAGGKGFLKGPSEVSERLTHRSCALPSSGTCSRGSSKPRANDAPLDVPEEGVDVLCRGRAEVHLVRALVHVHHEGRQRGGR